MSVQKHKPPPQGWGEEEWRRYQEGLATKKAAEEALGKSDVPTEAAFERPAAEIVGDLMKDIRHKDEHRGPWVEVRHREKEPDPLVEWLKRLFRRKPKE